jgi:hypothetical protein
MVPFVAPEPILNLSLNIRLFFCKIVKEVVQPLILLMPSCLTLKDEAQTALFKDPVRTAQ